MRRALSFFLLGALCCSGNEQRFFVALPDDELALEFLIVLEPSGSASSIERIDRSHSLELSPTEGSSTFLVAFDAQTLNALHPFVDLEKGEIALKQQTQSCPNGRVSPSKISVAVPPERRGYELENTASGFVSASSDRLAFLDGWSLELSLTERPCNGGDPVELEPFAEKAELFGPGVSGMDPPAINRVEYVNDDRVLLLTGAFAMVVDRSGPVPEDPEHRAVIPGASDLIRLPDDGDHAFRGLVVSHSPAKIFEVFVGDDGTLEVVLRASLDGDLESVGYDPKTGAVLIGGQVGLVVTATSAAGPFTAHQLQTDEDLELIVVPNSPSLPQFIVENQNDTVFAIEVRGDQIEVVEEKLFDQIVDPYGAIKALAVAGSDGGVPRVFAGTRTGTILERLRLGEWKPMDYEVPESARPCVDPDPECGHLFGTQWIQDLEFSSASGVLYLAPNFCSGLFALRLSDLCPTLVRTPGVVTADHIFRAVTISESRIAAAGNLGALYDGAKAQ